MTDASLTPEIYNDFGLPLAEIAAQKKVELTSFCGVSYHASRISNDAHALYWVESTTGERNETLRNNVIDSLRRMADEMGFSVVPK